MILCRNDVHAQFIAYLLKTAIGSCCVSTVFTRIQFTFSTCLGIMHGGDGVWEAKKLAKFFFSLLLLPTRWRETQNELKSNFGIPLNFMQKNCLFDLIASVFSRFFFSSSRHITRSFLPLLARACVCFSVRFSVYLRSLHHATYSLQFRTPLLRLIVPWAIHLEHT